MGSRLDGDRSEKIWALGVFFAAFALPLGVYLFTLSPDLTWAHEGADGGDLIVAAYTLGIPHPPGYPAYTLLAHLFTLLPWGSVAFRVNLLSALGAAIAVGITALAASTLSARERSWDVFAGAMAAAWGLAFVPVLWSQAVIAEVYAVHAAFVALTIWLALRANAHPTAWDAALLGFVWALSLGIHLTALFLLPIVLWGMLTPNRQAMMTRAWMGFAIGVVLASFQWLYLPWRAGRGAITWGDPATLDGWWWLVSGELYRGYAFAFPLDRWLSRLAYFAGMLLTGLGPLALFLGLLGWNRLAQRNAGLVLAAGTSFLAMVVFAIGYNTSDSNNYLIPAVLIFSIGIGSGVTYFLDWLRAQWGKWALALGRGVLLLAPLLLVFMNWSSTALTSDQQAIDFGRTVMASVPARAVLLTNEDQVTFTLWYFHYVLKERSDIAIMDEGLLAFDWYRAQVGLTRAEVVSIVNRDEVTRLLPVCQVSIENQLPRVECLHKR